MYPSWIHNLDDVKKWTTERRPNGIQSRNPKRSLGDDGLICPDQNQTLPEHLYCVPRFAEMCQNGTVVMSEELGLNERLWRCCRGLKECIIRNRHGFKKNIKIKMALTQYMRIVLIHGVHPWLVSDYCCPSLDHCWRWNAIWWFIMSLGLCTKVQARGSCDWRSLIFVLVLLPALGFNWRSATDVLCLFDSVPQAIFLLPIAGVSYDWRSAITVLVVLPALGFNWRSATDILCLFDSVPQAIVLLPIAGVSCDWRSAITVLAGTKFWLAFYHRCPMSLGLCTKVQSFSPDCWRILRVWTWSVECFLEKFKLFSFLWFKLGAIKDGDWAYIVLTACIYCRCNEDKVWLVAAYCFCLPICGAESQATTGSAFSLRK